MLSGSEASHDSVPTRAALGLNDESFGRVPHVPPIFWADVG